MMDTLFNTHFDSTPSRHDLPGVKLKASTYGMINYWTFHRFIWYDQLLDISLVQGQHIWYDQLLDIS